MDQQTNGPALREYFSMLYRRKFMVLAVFVLTTGAVATGAFLLPPVFTASTTLIVKFGREFIYRPEVGGLESSKTFSLEEMVNSEVEILSSRDLARQVVEELGVETLYPRLLKDDLEPDTLAAKAIATFQDRVTITAVFESSIIRITFEHEDAHLAAEALNILVERFKDKHLEIFGESKSGFLGVQLDRYRQSLADAETALKSFKQENGVYQLAGQKDAILTERVQLQTELRQTRFRITELEEQRKVFEKGANGGAGVLPHEAFSQQRAALTKRRSEVAGLLQEADSRIAELTDSLSRLKESGDSKGPAPFQPGVERFRSLDEANIRLLDLELKYLDLRRNYNKDSREVEAVRKEILLVKTFLKERGEYVGGVLEAGIREELNALKVRRKTLAAQLSDLDSSIRSLGLYERSVQAQTLDTELASLEIKKEALVAELARRVEELSALDAKETTLRRLEREVTVNERSFQIYLEKFEEAKTTEELDKQKVVNLRVIERAAPPVGPTGISKKMKIALGSVVGLLAGVAAAFFRELLAP